MKLGALSKPSLKGHLTYNDIRVCDWIIVIKLTLCISNKL